VREIVERVACLLGNTARILERSYLHPAVPRAFREGRLAGTLDAPAIEGLRPEECGLVALLRSEG
jgi:DNA topoisomerase IB